MSIFSKFRTQPKAVGAESMVALTDDGKRAVDKLMADSRSLPALLALDEHSPRSVMDLSRECKIDLSQMKKIVFRLDKQRLVRVLE